MVESVQRLVWLLAVALSVGVALSAPSSSEATYGYDAVADVVRSTQHAALVGTTSILDPHAGTSVARTTSADVSWSATSSQARFRAAKPGPARFIVDSAGRTIDRTSVATRVSAQRQGRHVVGAREYSGGSYFRSADDAQRVLDDFHTGTAEILGVKGNDIVVRTRSVTGINHIPGAGYPHQPTNVFFIKGSRSPSVVPYNPRWGG